MPSVPKTAVVTDAAGPAPSRLIDTVESPRGIRHENLANVTVKDRACEDAGVADDSRPDVGSRRSCLPRSTGENSGELMQAPIIVAHIKRIVSRGIVIERRGVGVDVGHSAAKIDGRHARCRASAIIGVAYVCRWSSEILRSIHAAGPRSPLEHNQLSSHASCTYVLHERYLRAVHRKYNRSRCRCTCSRVVSSSMAKALFRCILSKKVIESDHGGYAGCSVHEVSERPIKIACRIARNRNAVPSGASCRRCDGHDSSRSRGCNTNKAAVAGKIDAVRKIRRPSGRASGSASSIIRARTGPIARVAAGSRHDQLIPTTRNRDCRPEISSPREGSRVNRGNSCVRPCQTRVVNDEIRLRGRAALPLLYQSRISLDNCLRQRFSTLPR